MKAALRKLLIYGHRYLGMALSLLFLMWFLTGIGMIYSRGMPRLTPETRLARMAPIDLDAVRFTPIEAVSKAGLIGPGPQTTLLTVLGRPAYRYDGRGTDIVFADTGELRRARAGGRHPRSPLPVLRVKLDDPDKTWLYIDPYVAQVVGRVNRANRVERWLYAGLHTFDFPFLYNRRPLWDAVIIVFCLGGALLSGIGVVLGFKRIVRGVDRMTAVPENG